MIVTLCEKSLARLSRFMLKWRFFKERFGAESFFELILGIVPNNN
jgi:hypothetical protein